MGQALLETAVAEKLTLDVWGAMPEDEPGELVNGLLVEEEVPSYVHELLVALLVRALGNWIIPLGGLVAGSDAVDRLQAAADGDAGA